MRRRSRRRGEERRGEEGAGRARQIRAQRGCQNHHKISPDTPLHLGHPGLPAPLIEDRWSPPGVQLLWVRASPPPAPPQPPDRGGRGLGRPSHSLDNWGRLDCYIKILTAIVQGMDHIEHILHSQGSRGPGQQARQYKQSFHHLAVSQTFQPYQAFLIIITVTPPDCRVNGVPGHLKSFFVP